MGGQTRFSESVHSNERIVALSNRLKAISDSFTFWPIHMNIKTIQYRCMYTYNVLFIASEFAMIIFVSIQLVAAMIQLKK